MLFFYVQVHASIACMDGAINQIISRKLSNSFNEMLLRFESTTSARMSGLSARVLVFVEILKE